MSDLIDTTEMYLKTVYELEEEGVVPLRARIAERLGHSGPTVSQTVARMERDGLLVLTGNRQLELTPVGRERAIHVMRKHRLAERLLVDVVGLDWPHVHEEACRWEHVMSEQVERRLLDLLDHPHVDPYGNPIPGLEQLGEQPALPPRDEVRALADVVAELVPAGQDGPGDGADGHVVLARIGEPLQVDVELLSRMLEAGLRPGARLAVRPRADGDLVSLHAPGAETVLDLPEEITRHLFVSTER
ncbi:metal-dependent transcriptional regulator [Georgenia sp. TF02-10]|uniref:metal-dependent transcriptional regulator n=1 Tax=Georgenia sp. TF02-10 TaxID=2917725 RepID=UPI001FA75629|nr:metal-dependent transcriptional regulator [Georgenia sp. TF02-10]UNX55415.1 metal-dependent transcriptional regulator [Georgenia sp. TF02-10]